MPIFLEIPMLDRVTFFLKIAFIWLSFYINVSIVHIISVTKKSELLEKVHLVMPFFIDVKTMDWCVLSRYFTFFSLDRLVTKNRILDTKCQPKFLWLSQFEKWTEHPGLFSFLKQQQKLQLTFVKVPIIQVSSKMAF